MDDNKPVPMLNSPIETGVSAGEVFAQTVLGRMDRAHALFIDKSHTLAEPPEQARERVERFKQEVIARVSELTGLEFDSDGKCITPGQVRMEGAFKEEWAQVCQEFAAQKDPQRAEQLFGEAGRLLRGAVETPEVKPTPADRIDS
jgi:hypothetical protein